MLALIPEHGRMLGSLVLKIGGMHAHSGRGEGRQSRAYTGFQVHTQSNECLQRSLMLPDFSLLIQWFSCIPSLQRDRGMQPFSYLCGGPVW